MGEIKELVMNSNFDYKYEAPEVFSQEDVIDDYLKKIFSIVPPDSIRQ